MEWNNQRAISEFFSSRHYFFWCWLPTHQLDPFLTKSWETSRLQQELNRLFGWTTPTIFFSAQIHCSTSVWTCQFFRLWHQFCGKKGGGVGRWGNRQATRLKTWSFSQQITGQKYANKKQKKIHWNGKMWWMNWTRANFTSFLNNLRRLN